MLPLERIPAVRQITTDRTDVFAVELTGEFSSADAENLCGLLEGAYAISDRIDLLVRIHALTSVDTTELSAETATLIHREATAHVGRCAIIDDASWASEVSHLLFSGSGVDTRRFDAENAQDAWEWLGAREIPEGI